MFHKAEVSLIPKLRIIYQAAYYYTIPMQQHNNSRLRGLCTVLSSNCKISLDISQVIKHEFMTEDIHSPFGYGTKSVAMRLVF